MMNKRTIASFLSLALLSSNVLLAQTVSSDLEMPSTKPMTFVEQVQNYFLFASVGLAVSFRHKFGENSIAGNDRIIFASIYNLEEEFDEGIKLGGTVLGAISQCNAAKELYEENYGTGVCDQIQQYAPGYHSFESTVWDATLKYVIAPAAVVGTIVTAATVFCVQKKLKQS